MTYFWRGDGWPVSTTTSEAAIFDPRLELFVLQNVSHCLYRISNQKDEMYPSVCSDNVDDAYNKLLSSLKRRVSKS